ncbi:E3 ubiquitin-protein ligase RLIM protein [Trifolium repens]|nr:E3 ubiquitin-protein ligase RLIM protein [Trifolium repens]
MDNNKKQAWSSSSSTVKFDQLFGPKDPSAASSSSFFGSIFPPPPPSVEGRGSRTQEVANKNLGAPGTPTSGITNKNTSTNYQNEKVEPIYFSSSIHYGGQENYSSKGRTTESHHVFKKDANNGHPNGNNSNTASRGDWWEGSLYY